jgi:hypothetical protein
MYCLRSFIVSAGNLDVLFGKRGGLFLIVQFIDSFRCRVEEYIRAACLHASRNAFFRSRGIVSLHHHFVRIRLRAISIRDYATKATFFLSSEANTEQRKHRDKPKRKFVHEAVSIEVHLHTTICLPRLVSQSPADTATMVPRRGQFKHHDLFEQLSYWEKVVRPERFELPAFWFPPPADSIQLAAQPTTGA